ncbi:amidohydrolase family protein, partial [Microbacterium sp. CPCC 204701]|uniref:amidohydrolase family protein n=1 Tax=Microbacterium sp. CPCC 204701 TaxID=2493084 RepID=UPI0013E4016C
MTATLITNIGELTTNVGRDGDPCGTLREAAVLIEGDRIGWVGGAADAPASGLADLAVVDARGSAVVPGFVDSHTHLVFGGDRADEFEARMAGTPYAAGGIRRTVAATRAASDTELRARLRGFVDELHAQGTTTFEIKTGYGLTVRDEERLARLAAEVTPEVTFLGAHVVPAEYSERRDQYVELVCDEMLRAVAPHARWVDVFCERGAFTPDEARRVLAAGAAR